MKPLPPRVEERLQELKKMNEFTDADIDHCRRTYWDDRDFWHATLIACFDRAKGRAA